jgi:hypothetical protein
MTSLQVGFELPTPYYLINNTALTCLQKTSPRKALAGQEVRSLVLRGHINELNRPRGDHVPDPVVLDINCSDRWW